MRGCVPAQSEQGRRILFFMGAPDSSSSCKRLVAGAAFAVTLFGAGGAPAQPNDGVHSVTDCIATYERAQELQRAQQLLRARQELRACAAAPTCPAIAHTDCTTWLGQVLEAIPSVVFSARVGDESVFDVSVFIDGKPLVTHLDGKPIEVDPGLHDFTFQRTGAPALQRRTIIPVREQAQAVTVAWPSPAATTPPEPPRPTARPPTAPRKPPAAVRSDPDRPIAPLFFVLSGAALVGFGGFAALGLSAESMKHDLESTCSPGCSDNSVDTLKTQLLLADVSLGIGVASAVGAFFVLFDRSERTPAQKSGFSSVGITPGAHGAALHWAGQF
jgi:hypothetical protein